MRLFLSNRPSPLTNEATAEQVVCGGDCQVVALCVKIMLYLPFFHEITADSRLPLTFFLRFFPFIFRFVFPTLFSHKNGGGGGGGGGGGTRRTNKNYKRERRERREKGGGSFHQLPFNQREKEERKKEEKKLHQTIWTSLCVETFSGRREREKRGKKFCSIGSWDGIINKKEGERGEREGRTHYPIPTSPSLFPLFSPIDQRDGI